MTHATIILIAGPTAAGKSALAIDLAQRHNGVIINTDALQIYAGLPILSAQPNESELKTVPHRLYSALKPDEKSSAGIWRDMAQNAVKNAQNEGKTPILVGGTGLYFRAFFGGLSAIPDVPESVRAEVENLYTALGESAFRTRLAEMDTDSAARLARNDRQRLIRAYEVALYTGKPLSYWHKMNEKPAQNASEWDIQPHLILPPRDELYARCDARFTTMIERGALDEVQKFLSHGYAPILPVMKTIGVREIGAYLNGKCTLNDAISAAQQATRNYAKRQMTWFRNQWKF